MTANGYAGWILHVDLTTGEIAKVPLDMELAKAFIGGVGLNNRLAYDIIKPGVNALAPDNPIIRHRPFCRNAHSGSRQSVCHIQSPFNRGHCHGIRRWKFRGHAKICRL
ncbi:MAG: aldehyde ferredoxin oxidoreductase N-terminal domain-containing protein [Desulfobacterales bacterium]|nr:aldehyde ferredoxin oxidoreductase N-terminal domain-containing protein [Desulfobacterales bacterium]